MGMIELWQWNLDLPGAGGAADRAVLSAAECARADRYIVAHAGRRFIAGRAGLRRVLAAQTGRLASSLEIATGANGKPFLPGGPHFNLSHSGNQALCAIAAFPLGIDIEAIRPIEPEMAALVFTAAEQDYLAGLADAARLAAFYRGWTRKEAIIKARGASIANMQEITALPDPLWPDSPGPDGPWQVTDLAVGGAHAAALAACCAGWQVTWRGRQNGAA